MAQEVSCKIIRTVLDFARDAAGEAAVRRIVTVAGVPYETLADEHSWVDHETEKRIFRALEEITEVRGAAFRCGEFGMRAGSFGALETLVRAMLRPRSVYSRAPFVANRLAKVGELEAVEVGADHARVKYTYFEDFESTEEICANRKGLLAAVPTLWGLPPATIDEVECSAHGYASCDYRIRWVEPLKRRMSWRYAGFGAAAGVSLVVAAALDAIWLPVPWGVAGALGLTALAWMAGRSRDDERQLEAVDEVVRRQNRELEEQLLEHEDRFRKLEELNLRLEEKVAKRTEELRDELERLRRLNDLSRDIGATLVADEIVDRAVRGLDDLMGVSGCGLFPSATWEETEDEVQPRVTTGPEQARELKARAARFLAGGKRWDVLDGPGDMTALWLRLDSGEDSLGALVVLRDRSEGGEGFSDRDVEIGRAYGEIVVAALANSRLFAETERLSVTDGLTGLYVHRYFQESLRGMAERARRYDHRFSLLMLDVDDFKPINDQYGHQAGDKILRAMASMLISQLRSADVATRYGGEEFSVILPYTPLKEAREVAERLRRAVEKTEVQVGDETLGVTVSIGVAEWAPGVTPDELIGVADAALYAAKRSGKNRVMVAAAGEDDDDSMDVDGGRRGRSGAAQRRPTPPPEAK